MFEAVIITLFIAVCIIVFGYLAVATTAWAVGNVSYHWKRHQKRKRNERTI